MSEEKPIVYIFRGDDREAIETQIRTFYRSLGAPDMADMNTTRLEGKTIRLNDLRAAALALPFLTERRLVILEDALKLFDGKADQDDRSQILELLDSLPPTTALVLLIPDVQKSRQRGGHWDTFWETLTPKHWLIKWADKAGGRAYIQDCALPTEREMGDWILRKAVDLGGSFKPNAAQVLAEYLGNNTQRVSQEIVKLLTYVNYERPVDDDDVRHVSIQDKQGDIFQFVDAIGARNGEEALKMLHRLLEEMPFSQVYPMIIRQFRLIMQAREIVDTGGDANEVRKILGLHPFIAKKITAQAGQFSLSMLEMIYHQLLKMDLDAKTGVMDGDIALDVFITRLAKGLDI